MTFNPTKSVCVAFSRKPLEPVSLKLGGRQFVWCDHTKHIGDYKSSDLREAKEISVKRSDLVGRVNTAIGNLQGVPAGGLVQVFRSKCCHYYGSQAWQYDQGCLKDFTTMWNRCVRRLLNLPNRTHTRFLPEITQMLSPSVQIARMFIKQVDSMMSSDNKFVKYLAKRAELYANTIIAGNLYVIEQSKLSCPRQLSKEDLCTTSIIKDLVFRDVPVLSTLQQLQLLHSLCVD